MSHVTVPAFYLSYQNEKPSEYGPRAREVEKATPTAAVYNEYIRWYQYGKGDGQYMLVRQIATNYEVKSQEL